MNCRAAARRAAAARCSCGGCSRGILRALSLACRLRVSPPPVLAGGRREPHVMDPSHYLRAAARRCKQASPAERKRVCPRRGAHCYALPAPSHLGAAILLWLEVRLSAGAARALPRSHAASAGGPYVYRPDGLLITSHRAASPPVGVASPRLWRRRGRALARAPLLAPASARTASSKSTNLTFHVSASIPACLPRVHRWPWPGSPARLVADGLVWWPQRMGSQRQRRATPYTHIWLACASQWIWVCTRRRRRRSCRTRAAQHSQSGPGTAPVLGAAQRCRRKHRRG